MCTLRAVAGAVALLCFAAVGMSAQGLSGTYTIANGNPGSAFNYGDLGDAFNAIEAQGLAGPVTLELYDTGGPFTSNASYQLGANATTVVPIAGMGAANPLIIRAAPGNSPVINGNGALNRYTSTAPGTLSFDGVQHVTIEGIEITGGQNYGLIFLMWSPGATIDNITIKRCRIHGITLGAAIVFYNPASTPGASNVLLENNMIWNCGGDAGTALFSRVKGVVGAGRAGANFVVRHNTIVHTTGGPDTSVFFNTGTGAVAWEDLSYNVTYFSHPSAMSYYRVENATTALLPTTANRNVVYLTGSTNMCNNPTYGSWAQWQAAGKDVNGVNADPQLENHVVPFDLRIKSTSPAVDLAVGSPVTVDLFGDARPVGPAPDSGAHEYGLPGAIEVSYNQTPIQHNGSVNLGVVPFVGNSYTFDISSVGLGDLVITGSIAIAPGVNCSTATAVQQQPASTQIPPLGSTSFTVFAQSVQPGPFDFLVTIPNNDSASSPFVFTVNATGENPNGSAFAAAVAGFALVAPGEFEIAVDPGAAMPAATIRIDDPDGDDLDITINAIGSPPAGILAPVSLTGAAPVDLMWNGTAGAANVPGAHEWAVSFHDVGPFATGTLVNILVRVIINDLPPVHSIANARGGDGSAGNPYTAQFTQGDSPTSAVNLCTVSDPNTSQVLSIVSVQPGTNPSGVGFQFNLSGGLLVVSPAGTLVFADSGIHTFDVTIEDDGGNSVSIAVSILVFGTSGSIVFLPDSLPDGIVDGPYNRTITVSGASGAVTLQVLPGGSLPPGISFEATTGVLSGTPTTAGSYSFTVRAEDSSYDTATHAYTVTIKPARVGSGGSGSGGGGCSKGGNSLPSAIASIAMLALVGNRRRRVTGVVTRQ